LILLIIYEKPNYMGLHISTAEKKRKKNVLINMTNRVRPSYSYGRKGKKLFLLKIMINRNTLSYISAAAIQKKIISFIS
jgi:hypothetical protein